MSILTRVGLSCRMKVLPDLRLLLILKIGMLWHKEHTFQGYPFAYVRQTNVKWRITDAFPNGGELTKSFIPEQEIAPVYSYEGKNIKRSK